MLRPTLDWRTPFLYMFRDPDWKRKIFVGGLWLLLFPPLGWPIALGYRREALSALVEGRRPILPPWGGQWPRYLKEGLKAAGVILVYFLPFLSVFWFAAIDDWLTVETHALELAAFVLAILLLLPVCLPLLPPLYWYLFPWVRLSPVEMILMGVVFWGTTFLMPAAFLQVSLHGGFQAAFRVDRMLVFVGRNLRGYLEAWAVSLVSTAVAAALGPGVAWGIFWSYLVIVYTFNEALFRSATPEVRRRFRNSPFA